MGKKYRVAVIGTGMIANAAHIPAYKFWKDDFELVACADIRKDAAQETADRHGIPKVYQDAYAMLEEVRPDFVSVCTPNAFHKEYALAAFKVGANVFCEKPLALKRKDAIELYKAADEAGVHLFVTQSLRFLTNYKEAKELAQSGELGEVYYADVELIRRRGIPKWGMFHIKEKSVGGCFCDLGVHITDYIMYLTGNPKLKSVSGSAVTRIVHQPSEKGVRYSIAESGAPSGLFTPRPFDMNEFDVEEFSNGYMRFENGMTVNFKISWALNLPNSECVRLSGDKGGLVMSNSGDAVKLVTTIGSNQADLTPRIFPDPYHEASDFYGHIHVFEHALKFLKGEQDEVIKREEVINVASVIEAFYKSAQLGREVSFEELEQ
ncbi:Gfo/Idh/MocA family oxidoreductase [Eubacteriales bacterium OttesenSCG-928-N13]|nr:Gfo/Idh/MocA family oxidoreductase [Eubacteriales bacterium OttesenSCG-928-N13]